MSDIALDSDGDLLITKGALSLVIGDDAIVQNLQIRLQFFLGEWFLDTRLGMPYFEEILTKNPDLTRVRGIFRQAILTTRGIASIVSLNMNFDRATRALAVDFVVKKTDGEILAFDREFIIE